MRFLSIEFFRKLRSSVNIDGRAKAWTPNGTLFRAWWAILALAIWGCGARSLDAEAPGKDNQKIGLSSVQVNGKPVSVRANQALKLGAYVEDVIFRFGAATNSDWVPKRLRYKLEGYDGAWREGGGEMNFTVRFYNRTGDQVSQKVYNVTGSSAGWNGSLKNSPLTHRRETVMVPPGASRLMVVISSAGPPETEGVYVVANLTVSETESNAFPTAALIASPLDGLGDSSNPEQGPSGWARDGTHPSMAKIVSIGRDPVVRAFAVLDNDPISHAEWRTSLVAAPKVTPGAKLVLEWNEMYSMGGGESSSATYRKLPPGRYDFRVQEVNIFGMPTGVEMALRVVVSAPFWRTPWFWGAVSAALLAGVIGIVRYATWRKMREEVLILKSQQALEQERLRIAQDIHDDLGARVTQISLLSAVAQENLEFSDKARSEFAQVSQMSRELVAALYETVWAVNPENDNLDAVGNYICQMVTMLCERPRLRCRFYVSDLPKMPQISSQTRHNLSMAVKEAVNNVIKHAKASEIVVRIELDSEFLRVSVTDDGCGFHLPTHAAGGNGLTNMKRRLEESGGTCTIQSESGKGTTILLCLAINKPLVFSNS
jgi:signal transduction histidine kinase